MMVSLVNFKIVNEELRQPQYRPAAQSQQHQRDTTDAPQRAANTLDASLVSAPSVSVSVRETCARHHCPPSSCETRTYAHRVRGHTRGRSIVTLPTDQSPDNDTCASEPVSPSTGATITLGAPALRCVELHQFGPTKHQRQLDEDAPKRPDDTGTISVGVQLDKQQPNNQVTSGASLGADANQQPGPLLLPNSGRAANDVGRHAFTVTWRNLKYCIEPKWHEKALARLMAPHSSKQQQQQQQAAKPTVDCRRTTAVRVMPAHNDFEATLQAQADQVSSLKCSDSKVVLDFLDGSFRSGELTAILGPSGAGKTTLLDCLTGHRKNGLSGTIRIDSGTLAAPPPAHTSHELAAGARADNTLKLDVDDDYDDEHGDSNTELKLRDANSTSHANHRHEAAITMCAGVCVDTPAARAAAAQCCTKTNKSPNHKPRPADKRHANRCAGNLKVSIIPQNDHLMSYLSVYETLSYASKMKNCFDTHFDHKTNVKRVAQQLGLVMCLDTRINKLSGGQYKRVSIAQELLSSPDILILDEPTSGLDAMTCYQTVQVLRRLTDERQTSSGQKPIAIILTIHQPNSDVFQQFNHVYVVAQGGKCIYEGAPANIEFVINRIGLRMPSSYYNPATMIVEIAAGKFGPEAVFKLNAIQRAQYASGAHASRAAGQAGDEYNSTGDSAVDLPSSSSTNEDDDARYDSSRVTFFTKHHETSVPNVNENDDNNNAVDSANEYDTNQADASEPENGIECDRTCKLECGARDRRDATEGGGGGGGVVNRGFVIDTFDIAPVNDNNNNKLCVDPMLVATQVDASKVTMFSQTADASARRKRRRTKRATRLGQSGLEAGLEQSTDHQQQQQGLRSAPVDTFVDPALLGLAAVGPHQSVALCHRVVPHACYVRKGATGGGGGGGDGDDGDSRGGAAGAGGANGGQQDTRTGKRLKLNSLKADQRFPFWRHTYLHFHRSWLSIVRDPMLCSMQLALHILVPLMVSLVYGTGVGRPNACPRAGPVDIMAYALEPQDSALQLQEDLRTTLENIGYIFFKLYGIIFAAMTVTVLTFPLDMHVLVKEFRNGWYGLSSYFLGRTLADIPFQLTLPLLAMALSYYSTGQPSSYLQWRFFSITCILILSSLIAQSQGLLFGAILMDKMKAAVFVAPAATTPIILFAGFLVRTQSIPRYLRPLSNLSYLRYAIEACLISRYGFNQCECDPAIFNQTVPELPPIARSMLDYWLSSFRPASSEQHPASAPPPLPLAHDQNLLIETTTLEATQQAQNPDLFGKLIDSLARANSFGRNITSCEQVVPYPMIDYDLKDSQLVQCFAILLMMLIVVRLLTFFIVCFKVKRKV